MTFPGWDRRLLYAIAGDVRPEGIRFLRAWQRAEGGRAAFNPLNTTMPAPGATRYNSVGVKNYLDDLQGLAATLGTLRLAPYARLVAALRNPRLDAEHMLEAGASGLRTWGTSTATISAVLRS